MSSQNLDGENLIKPYDALLALYAQKNRDSFGRTYSENTDPERLPYQRDRDRIIHCPAFRRLKGKLQVVSPNKGDHYRTRLTHTIEVTQIARDLARQLQLNEDLCEAIALAHDLGHTPFGHAGEYALNQKMKAFGKHFEHNLQSIKIVTELEKRYPEFPGLNLSYEVIEGLRKHDQGFTRPDGVEVNWPSLESQLVDLCDEMAYLAADLEDAFRGGFLSWKQLEQNQLCQFVIKGFSKNESGFEFQTPELSPSRLSHQLLHKLIHQLSTDSISNIQNLPPLKDGTKEGLDQIKALQTPTKLIAFTPKFEAQFLDLKSFLYKNFYERPEVRSHTEQGKQIISDVFDHLLLHPTDIPENFQSGQSIEDRICNYIAGMTDEFAIRFLA